MIKTASLRYFAFVMLGYIATDIPSTPTMDCKVFLSLPEVSQTLSALRAKRVTVHGHVTADEFLVTRLQKIAAGFVDGKPRLVVLDLSSHIFGSDDQTMFANDQILIYKFGVCDEWEKITSSNLFHRDMNTYGRMIGDFIKTLVLLDCSEGRNTPSNGPL